MTRRILCAALMLIASFGFQPAYSSERQAEATRRISTAMDFLTALGRLDFAPAGMLLEEDAVLDLPFAGSGMTVKGREEILRFFQKIMSGSVQAIDYKLERAYPSSRSDDVVLEISTQVHTASAWNMRNASSPSLLFDAAKSSCFGSILIPQPRLNDDYFH